MHDIDDLQRILGKTRRQVRERLNALAAEGNLLDGQVRKGPHGRNHYSTGVLEMIRDLDAEVQQENITLRQAAGQVAAKIRGNINGNVNSYDSRTDGKSVVADGELVAALRAQVASQEREIARLERENERLWQLVNEQLPRLPSSRERNPWWWPLRRFVFGG